MLKFGSQRKFQYTKNEEKKCKSCHIPGNWFESAFSSSLLAISNKFLSIYFDNHKIEHLFLNWIILELSACAVLYELRVENGKIHSTVV